MTTAAHTAMSSFESLACPSCGSELAQDRERLVCHCGAVYPVLNGTPMLIASIDDHSRRQAAWFDDDGDAEWEIERPHGAPRLYGWLMREKFRLAVAGIPLVGRTAVSVCAGSGMDAELLAAAGAATVAVDISPGAIARCRERARRRGLDIVTVAGDAARLPLADRSVDVAFVHDGLHHLTEPLAGVAELARVARSAVCVTEPARARVTNIAVRLGLALEREDAGNRVARLDLREVEDVLRAHGFRIVRSRRYGMYYRHEPGRVVRLLSRRGLFGCAVAAFRLANAAAGRFGNKLVVVAVRP